MTSQKVNCGKMGQNHKQLPFSLSVGYFQYSKLHRALNLFRR